MAAVLVERTTVGTFILLGTHPPLRVECHELSEVTEVLEHYNGLGSYILKNEPSHSTASRTSVCPLCRAVRNAHKVAW